MKVGIIGFGFVGKALFHGLKKNVEIIKIDPELGTDINDLKEFGPEFVFISVPTPMNNDGSQDTSILNLVFNQLQDLKLNATFILKSTVTPNNLNLLEKKLDFVYNPEFLREKSAVEDFINGEIILFGGKKELCKKASNFYCDFTLCKQKEHFIADKATASLVKYAINSFLATKVIYFNQLESVLRLSSPDTDWSSFVKIISADKRIGESHMDVPGHDGRKGFGGACFPKDISALEKFSSEKGINFSLIKEVIKINNKIRSVYNDPIEREADQNISFKGID
tara:strand:+ start:63 stop:905 length:843 start_codon:yes stop_codon:yes gene_type:complete